MAPSFLKKTAVYLGLVDDEYDDYDDFEDRAPRRVLVGHPGGLERRGGPEPEPEPAVAAPPGRIRTLPRETTPPATPSGSSVTPRPNSVRPVTPDAAKVQVVAPARFGDAKEIADCLKANRPVIVNLQVAERDLQRRMIDFCSGVTYALSGEMEKVADQVFLLAPTNVKVSEEERQRLQERGFGRP